MILNVDAYNSLFPTVEAENMQINTWYLSRDIIGYFKCSNLAVDLILEVIDFINSQNKITELSIVTGSGKNYKYRLLYNSRDRESVLNKNVLKENAHILKTVDLTMKYLLKVYNIKGMLVDEYLYNSTVLHFSLIDNTIEIMLDFGSVFNPDNRLYLSLIYLYHTGLVKKGSENAIDELLLMLEKNMDMDIIIQKIKSKGGIAVSDGMYQYIENCVIVLHDDHLRFFSENPVLSEINKTEFNGVISGLEKIIGERFRKIETEGGQIKCRK